MTSKTITVTLHPRDIALFEERERMLSNKVDSTYNLKRLGEINTLLACSYITAIKQQQRRETQS